MILFNPSMAKVGSKMTPNKNLMQYLRAVWIFLCGILIFLFPGCTQHILKVLKKYICKFLKYSKINSLGSILTPSWATVCAKKNHMRNTREHQIVLMDFHLQRHLQKEKNNKLEYTSAKTYKDMK